MSILHLPQHQILMSWVSIEKPYVHTQHKLLMESLIQLCYASAIDACHYIMLIQNPWQKFSKHD
jgi:hypothetical protein